MSCMLRLSVAASRHSSRLNLRMMASKSASASSASASASSSSSAEEFGGSAPVVNDSFARGLFSGKILSKQVFPFPAASILSDEDKQNVKDFLEPTQQFFEQVNNPAKNDADASIPAEVLEQLKQLGAFGLQVPTDLGGLGLSNTAYARLVEVVGANDLGVGITLGAHQSIGFKGILIVGNDAQKSKYLPACASGEKIAAFCLTEPSSGSDANSIRTRAKLSADGKHYILNGSKIWISGGGTAEIFTVFAQTEVVDAKTGNKRDKVTAFIVERAFGGVSHGQPEKKMGIKCSNTAELYFENCKVPVENVLGEVGSGFKVAMAILNNGRFGMGAALSGTMKSLIKRACEHANERVQFGSKIKEYGLIQGKIAEMAMNIYAVESLAYIVASNMDRGSQDYQLEAAISKVYASEAAWKVCDETLQILGGMGFMTSAGVERVLRDLRIFRIFEGTNEILRLFVALTGVQSAGEHLRGLQKALKKPLANLGLLAAEGPKRIKRALGKPQGSLPKVHGDLRTAAGRIETQTAAFGAAVEYLLAKHGKEIIHEQLKLKRIAEAAMDIFAMVAVVSRANTSAVNRVESWDHETQLACTFCALAEQRVIQNLREVTSVVSTNLDESIKKIARQTIANGAYVPVHVLGF